MKRYWVCRQEQGMMVVFRCRDQLKAMHACVAERTRDEEAFARFREERLSVISGVVSAGEYVRPSHKEFKIPSRK